MYQTFECSDCKADLREVGFCERDCWDAHKCPECAEAWRIAHRLPCEFICFECNGEWTAVRGDRLCPSCRIAAARTTAEAMAIAGECVTDLFWYVVHELRIPALLDFLVAAPRRLRLLAGRARRHYRRNPGDRLLAIAFLLPVAAFGLAGCLF